MKRVCILLILFTLTSTPAAAQSLQDILKNALKGLPTAQPETQQNQPPSPSQSESPSQPQPDPTRQVSGDRRPPILFTYVCRYVESGRENDPRYKGLRELVAVSEQGANKMVAEECARNAHRGESFTCLAAGPCQRKFTQPPWQQREQQEAQKKASAVTSSDSSRSWAGQYACVSGDVRDSQVHFTGSGGRYHRGARDTEETLDRFQPQGAPWKCAPVN